MSKSKGTIPRICEQCGTEFFVRPSDIKAGGGFCCSNPCANASGRRVPKARRPLDERFWEKVIKTTSCWLWTGSGKSGYGRIWADRKIKTAHRVSWEMLRGPIPDGLFVLHNCPDGDNPLCVNPDHLFLGTKLDNSRDMVAKGRDYHPRGEQHSTSILTEKDVREIRSLYAQGDITQRLLGVRFGISEAVIQAILKRRIWKCV